MNLETVKTQSELVRKNTPIELYKVNNHEIWVKREDLCVDQVNFSKMRGVAARMAKVPEEYIGVLDSYHSKAGWGSTYLGVNMGKKMVVFHPWYKAQTELRENQVNAKALGAELIELQAGRSCILYHRAKKIMKERFGDNGYMLPNALKLEESVDETAEEVGYTDPKFFKDTVWVVSVSSGTIAAGVLKGLIERDAEVDVVIHMGYSRSENGVLNYMLKKLGRKDFGKLNIEYVDEGYSYKDAVQFDCPFPCNKYYDLKTWKWLVNNLEEGLVTDVASKTKKILFWNIGD